MIKVKVKKSNLYYNVVRCVELPSKTDSHVQKVRQKKKKKQNKLV